MNVCTKLHTFSRTSIMHINLDLGHWGLAGWWLTSFGWQQRVSAWKLKRRNKKQSDTKEKWRGFNREKWQEPLVCKSESNPFVHFIPSTSSLQSSPSERPNSFISCEFIRLQSLQTGESNYWKPPASFFIFIDKVALCWLWQPVQSWALHSSRQRWLSTRNGIFVWSQNRCFSLNLSETDANEAKLWLAVPCEKKRNK